MRKLIPFLAGKALRRIVEKYRPMPAPTEEEVEQARQVMFGMNKTERGWLWAVKVGDAKIWGEAIDEDRAHSDGFEACMRAYDYTIQ